MCIQNIKLRIWKLHQKASMCDKQFVCFNSRSAETRVKIWLGKYIKVLRWLPLLSIVRQLVLLFFIHCIVAPIVCEALSLVLLFNYVVLSVLPSFTIISLRKRELVAVLSVLAVVWLLV